MPFPRHCQAEMARTMIALSLPNKWLKVAVRRVAAASVLEYRKRRRLAVGRQPFVWAIVSHLTTLWVLAHSLPRHDWSLSLVAALCFFWVARHQGRHGR